MKEQPDYGLKQLMASYLNEQSLSLRKLSQQIGISPATLSRIMNGKQKPSVEHVKKLAQVLDVPISQLVGSDSIQMENERTQKVQETPMLDESLEEFLKFTYHQDKLQVTQDIQKEFEKYIEYAETKEGAKIISEQFEDKVNSIHEGGSLIQAFQQLYKEYTAEKIFSTKAILIGGILLYFIIAIDAIPDFLFGIGYLDDLLILQLGVHRLARMKS